MARIPALFKNAALIFFLSGVVAVPLWTWGGTISLEYFKLVMYFIAATIFWLWLYKDAALRHVPKHWQLLVGASWLVAAIPVAPIYLLVTRGWRNGALAVLSFFGVALSFFAATVVGVALSVAVMNALHLTSNFSVHKDSAPAALRRGPPG